MNDYDKAGRYLIKRDAVGFFRWLLRREDLAFQVWIDMMSGYVEPRVGGLCRDQVAIS